MKKRILLLSAAVIAMGLALPVFAAQSDSPMRSLQKIVPYSAGGGTAPFARAIASGLGDATPCTPAQLAAHAQAETARWVLVIPTHQIQPE